jgi:penicillin-binding protein 1A
VWEEPPAVTEVIDQSTARTMMTLLRAVTKYGTGAAASQLNHPLGGKTGTTSDYTDAWFLGFSPSVTCGVWVGFDSNQSLGKQETGAKAALPIWMAVMREAIAGKDDEQFLGDEESPPLHQAAAEIPANHGIGLSRRGENPSPAAGSPVRTRVAPALSVPATVPPDQTAVKPRVKPALRTQPTPAPAKATGAVKPALGITINR